MAVAKHLFLPLCVLAFAACASNQRTVRFGDRLFFTDGPCNPVVYSPSERPTRFVAMGRVEAEDFDSPKELERMLIKGACKLGADGLVDLQLASYDTLRTRFDEKTRESSLEMGATIHTATAIAIKLLPEERKTAPTPSPTPETPPTAPREEPATRHQAPSGDGQQDTPRGTPKAPDDLPVLMPDF